MNSLELSFLEVTSGISTLQSQTKARIYFLLSNQYLLKRKKTNQLQRSRPNDMSWQQPAIATQNSAGLCKPL